MILLRNEMNMFIYDIRKRKQELAHKNSKKYINNIETKLILENIFNPFTPNYKISRGKRMYQDCRLRVIS